MIQTVKNRLFTNWHLMRWVALAAGLFFIIQGFRYQDLISGLLGGFFLFQAVTNTGCLCGNCSIPAPVEADNKKNKDVEYTEIKEV